MKMSKRTAEGEALTELILEVFRVNGAMLDAGNRLARPHGLTSARWQVMGAIDLAGHTMTVAQIARRMGLARQGVQRIVNDLAKLGLVTVDANLDHKRAPLIGISEAGREALVGIDRAQAAWVNRLADGLGEGAISAALSLLWAIRARSEQVDALEGQGHGELQEPQ